MNSLQCDKLASFKKKYGADILAIVDAVRDGKTNHSPEWLAELALLKEGMAQWIGAEFKQEDYYEKSRDLIINTAKSIVNEEKQAEHKFSDDEVIEKMWKKSRAIGYAARVHNQRLQEGWCGRVH